MANGMANGFPNRLKFAGDVGDAVKRLTATAPSCIV
jgi:hypothetical protein